MMDSLTISSVLNAARFLVAYALLAVVFFAGIISVPLFSHITLSISFLMMAVYYWSISRPTLIPSWMVFVLGLLTDTLTMIPLGVNALMLLIIQRLVVRQRRYLMAQPFILLWLGFVVVNALSWLALWAGYQLLAHISLELNSVLFSFLISAFTFPFMYIILHQTHRILEDPPAKNSGKLKRVKKR